MLTQDACAFYEDVALYQQFNGVVLDAAEGKHIAEALGSKKVGHLHISFRFRGPHLTLCASS